MSVESATKVSHTCYIKDLQGEKVVPLQPDTLTLLFNSLEFHHQIWGPRTSEQVLRGERHTDTCVKDLTIGELDVYTRRVQTVFLQKTFAQNWAKSFMSELIQAIPTNALEALRFLLTVPDKKRPEYGETVDYSTDIELYKACKKTQDVACCIAAFDAALATKDAELIASAFEVLPGNNGKVAKYFLEKVQSALFLLSGQKDDDQKISKRLFSCLGTNVARTHQQKWIDFTYCFREYYRIDYQLDDSMLASAYSTTAKGTASLDAESPLYDHLNGMLQSADPQKTWEEIPDSEKKEHAVSFACLFLRVRLTSTNEQKLEAFRCITKEFMAETVKGLDSKLQESIQLLLKADNFLYKFGSPITIAERARLNDQLAGAGTKLAYSTSKEDVVEVDIDLYKQLKALNNSSDLDKIWKAISPELKLEYAVTFALMLAKLSNLKKPVSDVTKDFYKTIVLQLDPQTQKWIKGIIREP
ncbi:MAG: hypothetical protein LLF94_12185 [Chlamydiales bacterium]|nr:hypothetical protein [Chlamydiales bacterium]